MTCALFAPNFRLPTQVRQTFDRKVTHVVFEGGKRSTLAVAAARKTQKVKLVSPTWVQKCFKTNEEAVVSETETEETMASNEADDEAPDFRPIDEADFVPVTLSQDHVEVVERSQLPSKANKYPRQLSFSSLAGDQRAPSAPRRITRKPLRSTKEIRKQMARGSHNIEVETVLAECLPGDDESASQPVKRRIRLTTPRPAKRLRSGRLTGDGEDDPLAHLTPGAFKTPAAQMFDPFAYPDSDDEAASIDWGEYDGGDEEEAEDEKEKEKEKKKTTMTTEKQQDAVPLRPKTPVPGQRERAVKKGRRHRRRADVPAPALALVHSDDAVTSSDAQALTTPSRYRPRTSAPRGGIVLSTAGCHREDKGLILDASERLTPAYPVIRLSPQMRRPTTHLVVGDGEEMTVRKAYAVMLGAAIVSLDWVQSSMDAGRWLPSEPFEHVIAHVDRSALFRGKAFVLDLGGQLAETFVPEIIRLAGGHVVAGDESGADFTLTVDGSMGKKRAFGRRVSLDWLLRTIADAREAESEQ